MFLEHLICIWHFARYINIGPVLGGEAEDRKTNDYKCDEDHFQEVLTYRLDQRRADLTLAGKSGEASLRKCPLH